MTQRTTLRGVIVVHDFDSNGNPLRFALLTDDERKYVIEADASSASLSLADYNRKQVQLTGVKLTGGKNAIVVHEIRLLKKDLECSYFDVL